MALFFNLAYLEEISCNDPAKFLSVLKHFYEKKLPNRKKVPHYSRIDMIGSSFLINPKPLLNNEDKVDILYIIQYIKLAARRDYSLYEDYDIVSLPLTYFPDLNLEVIKRNPLLNITHKEIFFYYEKSKKDIRNGISIWKYKR
jgi:hypothetical protein